MKKNAIEKLKKNITDNWEEIEQNGFDEEVEEDIKKLDRGVVRAERRMKNFQQLIIYITVLLIILWLMFFVVIGVLSAPNNDMSPNVRGGDLVMFYRLDKSPNANDIVVYEHDGTKYVGRVIARGGDTIEIKEKGGVVVNGNSIVESKIYEGTLPREGLVKYPVQLGENEFFILADAREKAEDSRFFGKVEKSSIKGVVIGIFRRTDM